MRWRKVGLIFDPERRNAWMHSHATMPMAVLQRANSFRVYCSGRDIEGRSQVGYFELDLSDKPVVTRVHDEPVFQFGELGAFDDRGVLNSCFLRVGSAIYMYYVGVATSTTVPFRNYTGLAISDDGGDTFRRHSRGPILPPDEIDPFLTPLAFVMPENAGYTMWYTSGVRWTMENGAPKHYYHIKRARSADGITWQKKGEISIDFIGEEYAIARPWVVRDADGYRMWYSYRGNAYRIGYAESQDGISWMRKDDLGGLGPSNESWEDHMVCYASVFDHGGRRYMFYNGNEYGKGGVGLAVLE
jgi:hypothetical protein